METQHCILYLYNIDHNGHRKAGRKHFGFRCRWPVVESEIYDGPKSVYLQTNEATGNSGLVARGIWTVQ